MTWIVRRRAGARGAALTETFFLMIVLVPLLFGTAMLGKLVDIRQSSVLASRYTVWEATVHGGDAPPTDVHDRFFGRRADFHRAVDPPGGTAEVGNEPRAPNAGPGSRAGMPVQTRVAVGRAGAAALPYESTFESRGAEGVAPTLGSVVYRAGNLLDGRSGGTWDVEANGFVRGRVAVPVDGNGWLSNATLVEHSVIMSDGWSASGTDQLERRVKSFVPAGALESVANVLSAVSVVPVFKELKGLKGALGKVDASALPSIETHRLRAYREASE